MTHGFSELPTPPPPSPGRRKRRGREREEGKEGEGKGGMSKRRESSVNPALCKWNIGQDWFPPG